MINKLLRRRKGIKVIILEQLSNDSNAKTVTFIYLQFLRVKHKTKTTYKAMLRSILKTYNLINIGFPIYLVLFEVVLRTISSLDTSSFIGPALAASGLGLIVGVLKPKRISIDPMFEESLKQAGVSSVIIRDPKDEKVVIAGWITILIEILAWYWCCSVVLKNDPCNVIQGKNLPNLTKNGSLNTVLPLLIGAVNYIAGSILVSIKESE